VKATLPAVVRQSRNSTPMTASSMCLPAFSSATTHWTASQETCATHPHFVYTPHGAPQALHNAGRLAWGSGPRREKPDYTGLDVIIVRGDKIAALYVFLDSRPS
jgi:hypothetical protein